MSSSGLIYAVIVGAWAAYLVPMWLRRQDELNEARPTERFSTAIRLLSGRAAMERRVAKARGEIVEPGSDVDEDDAEPDPSVDVRGLAVPATEVRGPAQRATARPAPAVQSPRAKVLARRRRTTTSLFVAFTVGAVAAAVGGVALLWVPAVPAVLLTLYIGQMRRQERRRYEVRLDQRHAAEAARRLRSRPQQSVAHKGDERPQQAALQEQSQALRAQGPGHGRGASARPAASAGHAPPPQPPSPRQGRAEAAAAHHTADRRALVEQTDHAEWVDQQRAQQSADDGWDPVPVPLPTYVTAPVAPRSPGGIDLGAPDTWSSARSGTTPTEQSAPSHQAREGRDGREGRAGREPREDKPTPRRPPAGGRTPLFDQYADPERPRAANE